MERRRVYQRFVMPGEAKPAPGPYARSRVKPAPPWMYVASTLLVVFVAWLAWVVTHIAP